MANQTGSAVKAGGMIDPSIEPPISLSDVFDLPWLRAYLKGRATSHRTGRRKHRWKKPDTSTVYRWFRPGIYGVRLEVIRIGGSLCTSEAALKRFFQRITEADAANHGEQMTMPGDAAVEAAEAELEAAGV